MRPLRAGVVGAGYLGSFHAEKYAGLEGVELRGVADLDAGRGEALAVRLGTRAVRDFRALLPELDVVSVVVPPEGHFEVASACLQAGVHVLLEKPMTRTLPEAEALVALARERGRVLQVGHLERFNPALLAVREQMQAPLFIEAHRLAAFKTRGTEVDVVMDLMIHDIDIVLDLVPSEVQAVRSVGVPVLSDRVDIANARVEFANGCVANLTASRVSQGPMRKLRVFQPDSYVSLDLMAREVAICRRPGGTGAEAAIDLSTRRFEAADALLAEISAFLDSVRQQAPPRVPGEAGKRALEVALAVVEGL